MRILWKNRKVCLPYAAAYCIYGGRLECIYEGPRAASPRRRVQGGVSRSPTLVNHISNHDEQVVQRWQFLPVQFTRKKVGREPIVTDLAEIACRVPSRSVEDVNPCRSE